MTPSNRQLNEAFAHWARVGVLFGGRPAGRSPDLEQLLLDTARLCPEQARLFYLAVSWLSCYGNYVARHRLKRLAESELATDHQPALGALLSLAVHHGASKELLVAADVCGRGSQPQPLFLVQRRHAHLRELARKHAWKGGLPWGLWFADQPPKHDALRPARWILARNPEYRDRIIRKGDLRCSILLALEHDVPDGEIDSEVALSSHCAATRPAIRQALDDLEREGISLRHRSPGARNTTIRLGQPVTS